MIDRYTKAVLSVIAVALIYLCVVLTPLPGLNAQTAARPGDPTGPAQMVIVGWRAAPGETIPVSVTRPVPIVSGGEPVRIAGRVTTERSDGAADRVVLIGWEENSTRDRSNTAMRTFSKATPGLPVMNRTPVP